MNLLFIGLIALFMFHEQCTGVGHKKKKRKIKKEGWKHAKHKRGTVISFLGVRLDTAYFAENWKHCNKIIFKYVNNIMRPIFNEKVVKSKVYGILWTMHETYLCC